MIDGEIYRIWLITMLALSSATALAQSQSALDAISAGGCAGCHVIPGVAGADGDVGPDLSRIGVLAGARRRGYSAEKYIREAITKPDAFIAPDGTEDTYPSGVMLSAYEDSLTDADIDAVVRYLLKLGTRDQPETSEGLFRPETQLAAESAVEPFKPLDQKLNQAQVMLGRYLFFDRRLSANNSLSCASCHDPAHGFAGTEPLSRGYPSTSYFRNTPSLLNAARQPAFFHDGRISDLPSTIRDHLTEAHFMSNDGRLLIERMRQVPAYVQMFKKAFNAEPRFGQILNALAAYVSSLNSGNAPYDRYVKGNRDALSADAAAGYVLFNRKAGCVKCHSGDLLSDHKFYNLGLPKTNITESPERHVTFRRFFRLQGTPNYANLTEDPGRMAMTFKATDRGRFRTPMLRDVARTAPYMHNGSLKTLADVVAFYNNGVPTAGIRPLNLTAEEQRQLVAFLQSLSTPKVTVQPPSRPPYGTFELAKAPLTPNPNATRSVANSRVKPPPLAALPRPPAPLDNPITAAKARLGKLLYFDPRMSGDGSTSCHTCHAATTGWTIRTPISMGSPGTSHWRNAQTVLNVAYYGKLNWDGAKTSIEKQNSGAWTGVVAGNLDPALGEERMAQIPEYVSRFKSVFGTEKPGWPDALRAVATFQRTLSSRNTPFDRFARGDRNALSTAAKRGLLLFKGKAGCMQCHNGSLISDDSYHAIGVPQHEDFNFSPLKQITFRFELASKGVPEKEYTTSGTDEGLYYVTKRDVDRGKFRTPSLRELVHSAPYMHNGVFSTLEDVIDFYDAGGGSHPNRSPLIKRLNLSEAEKKDLAEFLRALSGEPIKVDRPKLPEYERN